MTKISPIYKNKIFYYELMQAFLYHGMKALDFKEIYLIQRHEDIDEGFTSGFYDQVDQNRKSTEQELKFEEECFLKLYNRTAQENPTPILDEYVKGANKYDIKGLLFFSGIFNDLFDDLKDFWPKSLEEAQIAGYNSSDFNFTFDFTVLTEEEYKNKYCIDETELRRRVLNKLNILEENKDRW